MLDSLVFLPMITRAQLIDVLFVIVPNSLLLDIAGPAEAFRLANLHRESRGLPPRFRLAFAGPAATPRTSVGLTLGDLVPLPDELDTPTWVVVVGQPTAHVTRVTPEITATARWLNDRLHDALLDADTPHRLVTICSGTLLAARAGLLGARRCTTHHELLPMLRTLAPQAEVIDNRVFVVDGALASSAGITAGIDVALHLIAEECGEALAATVAEDMVVYLRRSPRDTELSPFHMHRRHLHPTVHRVQDAIVTEPAARLGHGVAGRRRPRGRAPPVAAVHRPRRHLAVAVPPVDPSRARPPVPGVRRDGHAGRRGGRLRLRPAAAPRLEPPVGRIAPRCGPGRRTGCFGAGRTAHEQVTGRDIRRWESSL